MTTEAIVFGDVAAAVITYLNALLDPPVTERIPASRPATFVTVQRTGGSRPNLATDAAQLTIEAWAPTTAAAHDLAQLCRAHIGALAGRAVAGTVYSRIEEFGGPVFLPDVVSTQPRYTFTVSVFVRFASVV